MKTSQPSTAEQQAVVQSDGRIISVSAFAGTGKTTTLVHFAQARPHERMLYLAFNKAIQLEAAARFPENVTPPAKAAHETHACSH